MRIPMRKNIAPKGVTATEFRQIITTPLGQHLCDQFLRLENLPTPYLGKSQDGRNGEPNFPEPWIPHGTQADEDRWVASDPLSFDNLYTTYVGENDKPRIAALARKKVAEYQQTDEYIDTLDKIENAPDATKAKKALKAFDKQIKALYDAGKKAEIDKVKASKTYLNKGKDARRTYLALKREAFYKKCVKQVQKTQDYKDALKAVSDALTVTERRSMQAQLKRNIEQIAKDAKAEYLTTTKYQERRAKEQVDLHLDAGNLYSTLSAIFLKKPTGAKRNIEPRPLLGASEKTMKSDGTTAEVRVMYLSPAVRSNNPYYDQWMVFSAFPQDMDVVAEQKGLFPVDIDMSAVPDLEKKYDKVKKTFKKFGYNFRKNPAPLRDIKLCINPNTCPHAGSCSGLCLVDSGQMGTAIGAQRAGYFKTWYFYLYPLVFFRQLILELIKEAKASAGRGMILYGRLNGTSDIPWERYIDMDALTAYANENGGAMGGFYDYTKYPYKSRKSDSGRFALMGRPEAGDWINGQCPMSYDLTHSLSEALLSEGSCAFAVVDPKIEATKAAMDWIRAGFRVAVVVDQWKYHPKQLRFADSGTKRRLGFDARPNNVAGTMLGAKVASWFEKIPLLDDKGKQKIDKDGVPLYEEDQNGFPIFALISEDMAVTDFTDLAKTSINSRFPPDRAKNILIVDADETDFRFNDPKPSICILKPKGIYVAQPDNDFGYDAGDLYLFSRQKATGKRMPAKLNAAQSAFVFSADNVLAFQNFVLDELNKSSDETIDYMLEDAATAVNLKGGVSQSNLEESVQGFGKIKGRIKANIQDFIITKKNPRRRNKSKLQAVLHPTYGVWVLAYNGGIVDINGIDNWDSKASLKRALKKAGLGLNNNNVVTGKTGL